MPSAAPIADVPADHGGCRRSSGSGTQGHRPRTPARLLEVHGSRVRQGRVARSSLSSRAPRHRQRRDPIASRACASAHEPATRARSAGDRIGLAPRRPSNSDVASPPSGRGARPQVSLGTPYRAAVCGRARTRAKAKVTEFLDNERGRPERKPRGRRPMEFVINRSPVQV